MEILSKNYGWSPNEIREMRKEDIEMYLRIISTKNKIESDEIKKINKRQNGR